MNETEIKNKNDLWFAALMFTAAAGVVGGALTSDGSCLIDLPAERLPAVCAADSFLKLSVLVGICFICGFSAVMQPAEAAVPFFFGSGFGLCAAELCGAQNSPEIFLMILPGGIFSAAVLSYAARESMRMSFAVFRRTFMPAEYEPADIILYLKKFTLIFAMAACAAAADGLSAFVYNMLRK